MQDVRLRRTRGPRRPETLGSCDLAGRSRQPRADTRIASAERARVRSGLRCTTKHLAVEISLAFPSGSPGRKDPPWIAAADVRNEPLPRGAAAEIVNDDDTTKPANDLVRRSTLAAVLLSAFTLVACGSAEEKPTPRGSGPAVGDPQRMSVLLITVDTLRPDHLSCYGWKNGETPAFDALADQGILFETAITPVPITLPSHATIHTGRYPPSHGVRNNGAYRLGESTTTLAELFQAAGYRTGAFVGAYVLNHDFGLDQGFGTYDDQMPPAAPSSDGQAVARWEELERSADQVIEAAGSWLRSDPGKPFFAWLHLWDPHYPYSPPEPFRTRYSDDLYFGEVAYVDQQLGLLLADLRSAGLDENTLVVLTADHGESLGEHGEESHGIFIYDSTVHVPLILRLPGHNGAGQRISQLVRTLDIAPTILDLARQPVPAEMEGISLLPYLDDRADDRDATDPQLVCYLESLYPQENYGWAPLFGLRTDSEKYIRAPQRELYGLGDDQGELSNRIRQQPEAADRLDGQLMRLISQFSVDPSSSSTPAEMDAETLEKLRSLGYIWSPGGGSRDPQALRDPKQMLALNRQREEGVNLVNRGSIEEGIDALSEVATEDPQNPKVWENLADAHLRSGDLTQALVATERGLALQPNHPNLSVLRGTLLSRLGRGDEAVAYLTSLLDRHADRKTVQHHLGNALYLLGRYDEALAQYTEAEQQGLQNAGAPFQRGQIYVSRNQIQQAADAFEKATRLNPRFAMAWHNLGICLRRLDRPEEARTAFETAVALEPNDPLIHSTYGFFLFKQGDDREAERQLELALDLDPRYPGAHNNLARLLALGSTSVRDGKRAIHHAELSIEYFDGSPPEDYHVVHAEALFAAGRVQEALEINARLQAAHPGEEFYRRQRDRFEGKP